MHNKKQGFTLIELMAVVLILGILTAIAVPQYNKSVRRAEMLEGLANGKTVYDSALRYKATNGDAPLDFNKIDASFIGSDYGSGTTLNDGAFSYILKTDRVQVNSNRDTYQLHFMYPVTNSKGVFSPIICYPSTNWICQNTGKPLNDSDSPFYSTYKDTCTEIKY